MVVQFCKVEGISPDRRLLLSIKNLRNRREPRELGISPDKLLFYMSTTYKNGKPFQNSGICPVKLLLEIERVVRELSLPMDKGTVPLRRLWEISISVNMGIISPISEGIGPEKELLLKYRERKRTRK